jgi:hypothetical protein
MKLSAIVRTVSFMTACVTTSSVIAAEQLGVYAAPIDLTSPACLNYGDAVSCSAPLLNYFAGLDPNTKVSQGGYVLPTPQGGLKGYIVLGAGGAAALDNSDIIPSPTSQVENGFKSNAGSDSYFATGKTSTVAGNTADPDNNGLGTLNGAQAADLRGTWDVGLQWLSNALTFGTGRHDLMIGFDYNQPQNATTSLDFWALITVRDTAGELADINYEFKGPGIPGSLLPPNPWDSFTTTKTRDSLPNSTDFGTVNGVTCVNTVGAPPNGIPILPIPGGQCPVGYEVTIDNAQSTADTEIFAFLPELNKNLENFISLGYDVASVRMAFGCYNNNPTTDTVAKNPGVGYLVEGSAETTNCESGGFGDVYLLAGGVRGELPEPGTLVLFGLALGALGWSARRRLNT